MYLTCNQTQVQLPIATKATNTQEAGANVKESGLFSVASHLEDGELTLEAHLLGGWGTYVSSPPLSEGRGFLLGGRGEPNKEIKGGS